MFCAFGMSSPELEGEATDRWYAHRAEVQAGHDFECAQHPLLAALANVAFLLGACVQSVSMSSGAQRSTATVRSV